MSQKVSQNFAVFVPEKCHLSQKNSQKIPEWPQKNMACMKIGKKRYDWLVVNGATRNAQLFPTLNLSPIWHRAHLDVRASLFTFATDTLDVWVQGSAVTGWGERHSVEQTIYEFWLNSAWVKQN